MKKYIKIYLIILFPLWGLGGWLGAFCQTISTDKNAVIHSKLRVETINEADANDPTKANITISYADRLGRTLQTIGYQQSPSQKDIVVGATNYDSFGRPSFSVLPSPATSGTGAYQNNAIGLGQSFYGDNRPFSSVLAYDNSPLNRERELMGAGQIWQTNNKKSQIFNESAGVEIRSYRLDASNNIVLSGTYPSNSLVKKRFIDEQGHTSIEISDKRGRLIQQQQEDATGFITTYYIYDGLGRIKASIQPEGYELNVSINYNSTEWNRWIFFYIYDYRGRLVEKKVPSAEVEYFAYDKWDRKVVSQTALQRQFQRWTFYKYDAFNREIIRGEISDNSNLATMQANINLNSNRFESRTSSIPFYTNNTYPTSATENEYRQVNFYDNYTNWLPSGMTFDGANAYHAQHPEFQSMATGGMSKNTENNHWLFFANYYDNKHRIIQTFKHNLYDKVERSDFKYNFAGDLLETKRLLRDKNNIATIQVERFEYDNTGRRIDFKVAINGTPTETVCKYDYNEIGQLSTKKYFPNQSFVAGGTKDAIIRPSVDGIVTQNNTFDLARKYILLEPNNDIKALNLNTYKAEINLNAPQGTTIQGLQTMNFAYHLRGNLLGINLDNANNPIPKNTEGDLFSYKLDFESTGLYDGNIGKQTWQTADDKNLPLGVRSYTFGYDSPKRLKLATFAGIGSENYTLPNLSYDKNGNITNLQRNGKVGNTFDLMDNLSYAYNGNRLNQVSDAISGNNEVDLVPRGSGNYTYYNDGSLKSDDNERITNIIYDTFLKQPTELYLNDGTSIKYYYDGSGTLLKTLYSTNETWEFSGITYKNGLPFQMPTSEGRAVYKNSVWSLEFFYNDHLGNTRVGFRANGNNLEKTSETAFDPWGVVLRGVGQVNNTQNRYEFQGKESEKTFGLNRVNLGARTVNPTTGRMDNIDPLSEKYFTYSPYSYVHNNSVNAIDPDGKRVYFVGGAGNDVDGWNYINRWGSSFTNLGIDFIRVNASHGKAGDIAFTTQYRSSGFEMETRPPSMTNYIGGLSPSAYEFTGKMLPVQEKTLDATVALYKSELAKKPLAEGEQFNLAGYSYGSVLQAQAALKLATDGQVIDNLILIGSPVSDKSDLWNQLNSNKNIKNILRYDIKGDALSNPQDVYDYFIKGGLIQGGGQGDDAHHFDAARPGKQTDKLIDVITQWLQQQGVKN
jgi:RHS repeat-associated protein